MSRTKQDTSPPSPVGTGNGPSLQEFLLALHQGEPTPGTYGYFARFPDIEDPRWKGAPWFGDDPDGTGFARASPDQDTYAVISAFRADEETGECRRTKEQFFALMAAMIDDIGTKVPMERGLALPPSCLVETSPGNFQSWLLLDEPAMDLGQAEALLDGLVRSGLAVDGKDPGMKGVTRYGRPPVGHNSKAKYVEALGHPFQVRCHEWAADRRYTVDQIVAAYGVELREATPGFEPRDLTDEEKDAAVGRWVRMMRRIEAAGLYRKEKSNGWHDIECPWKDEHTDGKGDGAAVAEPSEQNNWFGGFRCHHGHCEERRLRDLRDWVYGGDV